MTSISPPRERPPPFSLRFSIGASLLGAILLIEAAFAAIGKFG